MSIEALERRWKAKRPPAEKAPAPSSDLADALADLIGEQVDRRVAEAMEQQSSPRRNRHLPTFDQGFTSDPQPSPASAPVTPPGDFSCVLRKDETGRTTALDVTAHGRRERFVVLRDGRGRATGMRLQQDAHPLPPAPSEGN